MQLSNFAPFISETINKWKLPYRMFIPFCTRLYKAINLHTYYLLLILSSFYPNYYFSLSLPKLPKLTITITTCCIYQTLFVDIYFNKLGTKYKPKIKTKHRCVGNLNGGNSVAI